MADLSQISTEDLIGYLKKAGVQKSAPPQFHPSGEKDLSYSNPELLAAHPLTRFATGAAAPFMGAAQLAGNAADAVLQNQDTGAPINEHMQNYEGMVQRGRQELGSTGVDWWNAGGQALPAIAAGAALPNAPTTLGRIGQGAAFGAAAGATQPVYDPSNYWGTKALQTGAGAAAGAVVPAAWEGAKAVGRGVRNVVQPYLGEWGANQAAGRLANTAAGDKADQVISSLQNAQPLVPGSSPTAGQAAVPASSPQFNALQEIAANRRPDIYAGQGIEGQQRNALAGAIRSVGKTPADLSAAEASRSANAALNYGTAFEQSIKGDPKLLQMAENPYFKAAMPDAVRLAEANGINPKSDLTQFLHYVKLSLDKQLSKTGDTALSSTEKAAVQGVKSDLVDWMGSKNPMYEAARAQFAGESKPINQMQVGQYLEQKLVPALSDEAKQRPAAYAQALRDAPGTIKRATGQPRFGGINEIMSPEQLETLRGVKADLERQALAKELASKGAESANARIGAAVPEMPSAGMFSPKISVGRSIYNRLVGGATDKILDDLAIKMQDPKAMASIMQSAKPFQRQALVDAMMRAQAAAAQREAMQQGNQ